MPKFQIANPKEPVIADRTVDLLAIYIWTCLAGWGIFSVLTGIPSIASASTPLYEILWGGAVGLSALVASAAAASTFVIPAKVSSRIMKKRVEMWAVSILAGFIAVYPIIAVTEALSGNPDAIARIFIAISFLGVPTWRVWHLYTRIRKLGDIALNSGQ